jgi:hypothetical protein
MSEKQHHRSWQLREHGLPARERGERKIYVTVANWWAWVGDNEGLAADVGMRDAVEKLDESLLIAHVRKRDDLDLRLFNQSSRLDDKQEAETYGTKVLDDVGDPSGIHPPDKERTTE